ncbi:MAG TPA: intradiol ring-cleavage dioxygenase [Cyclobacteriaceae bacterium]|nr:intradiol ring-cleavage dioxygenase [Cyclobacteriaceae bacterium]
MERKEFLKSLGMFSVIPILVSCSSDEDPTPSTTDNSGATTTTGSESSSSTSCAVSPSETAGPFPTKSPSSLQRVDIRSDRTGVELTIKITIQNKNASCAAMEGAIVDIWHCDKDGYYSEYGGTTMQSVNYASVHFLRGRQVSDANGLVTFTSIFPGWYPGRAPHVHVHIYTSSGDSLLVTQIAFPTEVCDTVYTTATEYYKNGKQDTSNARDGIFSDSLSSELASVEGNINHGYVLTHTIVVSA